MTAADYCPSCSRVSDVRRFNEAEAEARFPGFHEYGNIHYSGNLVGMRNLYGWDLRRVIKVDGYYYNLRGHPAMEQDLRDRYREGQEPPDYRHPRRALVAANPERLLPAWEVYVRYTVDGEPYTTYELIRAPTERGARHITEEELEAGERVVGVVPVPRGVRAR